MVIQRQCQQLEQGKKVNVWHGHAFWRVGDLRQIMNLDLVQFQQFQVQNLSQEVCFCVGDKEHTPHCPPCRYSNIVDRKGHQV